MNAFYTVYTKHTKGFTQEANTAEESRSDKGLDMELVNGSLYKNTTEIKDPLTADGERV